MKISMLYYYEIPQKSQERYSTNSKFLIDHRATTFAKVLIASCATICGKFYYLDNQSLLEYVV